MIAMFTDFGHRGPYMGQMEAVLASLAPDVPAIRLMSDAPTCAPRAAAYLLAAVSRSLPAGTVFLCVVDPGVGSSRRPLILNADGRWYVGPDNGLLSIVARRAAEVHWWEILWRPERLSASFHGRDLFAPTAAMLAMGDMPEAASCEPGVGADWLQDLDEIIHVDDFGNLCSGRRAAAMPEGAGIMIAGHRPVAGQTFSDVPPGHLFWYENAQGLVEIAANQASAAALMHAGVGTPLIITP